MPVKRILYFNGGTMDKGGISSFMMNYYRHFDHSKLQIDFVVHGQKNYYADEIKSSGGKIYVLPQKSKHPFVYNRELKHIFINGNYDIVHTHMDAMGAWVLKTAKQCGIPVRIAHSHNTQHLTNNPLHIVLLESARKQINKYATHCMACSESAGKWLFGKHDFQVVRNAIDINKFLFNKTARNEVRKEWNVENNFLIGNIARFDTQKNHLFLLDVFAGVHKHFLNTKLMLVGDGILRNSIELRIKKLQIQDAVILTGVRDDVERFYNAFDLFILPSLFEGLGIVSIESQINGCITLLSDQIPLEAKIAENVEFLSLDRNSWTKRLEQIISENPPRTAAGFDYKNSGYNIETEAKKLQEFYLNL
jgi:glycosyltransferase involved in cell wall biosynthesis